MLNCIVVDDQPLPIELLQGYIGKIPFLNLCGVFNDAFTALEFIKNAKVDLIFLDIEMPQINGIQLVKALENPPMIIFTTAYNQYAIEGFELDAIDYLLKPFEFERFLKAAIKAKEYKLFLTNKIPENKGSIFLKSNYSVVKVDLSQIYYIESIDDYVKVFLLNNNKPIMSKMTMKSISELLPSNDFLRVNRSFILSTSKIDSIRNKVIKLGHLEIPIGSTYVSAVQEFFNSRNL